MDLAIHCELGYTLVNRRGEVPSPYGLGDPRPTGWGTQPLRIQTIFMLPPDQSVILPKNPLVAEVSAPNTLRDGRATVFPDL